MNHSLTTHSVKSLPPVASLESVQVKVEPSSPESKFGSSDLDDLFARLTSGGASISSKAPAHSTPAGPSKSEFSFGDELDVEKTTKIPKSTTTDVPAAPSKTSLWGPTPVVQEEETRAPEVVVKERAVKTVEHKENLSQKDFEQLYLRKATEYVSALPSLNNVSVQIIKTVSEKLRSTYSPDTKLNPVEVGKLKARYAFAIINYINNVLKQSATPITQEALKKALQDCDGNMLALYGALVAEGHLKLDHIKDVVGLFKMIQDVLPKAELSATAPEFAPQPATAHEVKTEVAKEGSANGLKAWPTQEKRENRKYPSLNRITNLIANFQQLRCTVPASSRAFLVYRASTSFRL